MDAFIKIYKIKTTYDLLAPLLALQLQTAKHFHMCPARSPRASCRQKAGEVALRTHTTTIKWLNRMNFPRSPSGSVFKNTLFKTCLSHRCDAIGSADGLVLILRVFLNWSWDLPRTLTSPYALQHTGSGSRCWQQGEAWRPCGWGSGLGRNRWQPFQVTFSSYQRAELGGIAAAAWSAADCSALCIPCAASNPQWGLHGGCTPEHWENTVS